MSPPSRQRGEADVNTPAGFCWSWIARLGSTQRPDFQRLINVSVVASSLPPQIIECPRSAAAGGFDGQGLQWPEPAVFCAAF